jgi:hypothetical protein
MMEKNFLEIAKRNLEILQKTSATEQDVKRLIVEPIMLWAGIDIYDPNVLREEYPIQQINNSTRVDYAILLNETPQIAIEAKNISEDLNGSLRQLIGYCNFGNIRFGLMTNGREWWFIDETWQNSQDRVFLRIELGSEYIELIKLMNPYFSDILEAFAEDYRKIQNGRILNRQLLCEETIKKIKEREDQKRSQPENPELLSSSMEKFNVTLSEFLDFVLQKNMTNLKFPTTSIILNNKNIEIKSWRGILLNIIRSFDKINTDSFDTLLKKGIKITDSSQYHLITLEKETPDNRYSEVNIKGRIVYVYTWLNVNYIIKAINAVKKSMNLSDDYIKFSRTWFEEIKKELEEKK